ncbi:MAG TPA: hypothetical protein PLL20_18605 [Phycisphaerae bacterium]|mgnify:CR=1 FL=1|nr:hypothetical protein [Phycisphaerae bacterium]HRR84660.1 hypothetical protein [Phycisphaerae bacterium]
MSSRRIRGLIVTGMVVCLCLVLWVQAGDLNPPVGPVSPTMKTLEQLSAEHAQLASAIAGIPGGGGGGVKQVVRGVIELASGAVEGSANFTPEIMPSKSMVVLSDAVVVNMSDARNTLAGRTAACLMDLTASSLTIRVDEVPLTGIRRVSYQIIEYN